MIGKIEGHFYIVQSYNDSCTGHETVLNLKSVTHFRLTNVSESSWLTSTNIPYKRRGIIFYLNSYKPVQVNYRDELEAKKEYDELIETVGLL